MHNPLFKPPRHLVKEWPEVFEDLYMNTMPVAYLDIIHLEFDNGRVWEINIKEQVKTNKLQQVADKLFDTLQEFKDEIVKIDFKIDIERLKRDIADSTKAML